MRYGVLMYTDPAHTRAMSQAALDVVAAKHEAFRNELFASGELVGGLAFAAAEETLVLLPRGESRGGPFNDRIEQLSAYYEIECASLERARAIAARVLDDHVTAVELRRVHDTANAHRP